MKILIIEDDRAISRAIAAALGSRYAFDQAFDGEEGLFFAQQNVYDLVVLDIMLPALDGYGVLERLRADGMDTPVLMLTAKNARDELVLRVEAIIRRSMGVRTLDAFGFRGLTLDPNTRRAAVDGAPVVLKGKQYDVLEYLVSHEGQLVSKTQLFDRVWGFMNDTSSNVVEVYVSALRKVLKGHGYDRFLKTIRGAGYVWTDDDGL